MQYSEFEKQIDRLRIVYSAASLNAERIKVLWDKFKGDRADLFERVVSHMIAEFTTQQLPAMSRFVEAAGLFRTRPDGAAWMQEFLPAHNCEICRDMGWDAINYDRRTGSGTVVACKCPAGRGVGPSELAKIQSDFDKGARLLRGKEKIVGMPLPYNPNERINAGEW